jgi:hypothetical protein
VFLSPRRWNTHVSSGKKQCKSSTTFSCSYRRKACLAVPDFPQVPSAPRRSALCLPAEIYSAPCMFLKRFKIEIVDGVTEAITYHGESKRSKTVLLRIGQHSISKKAAQLGLLLAFFEVLDGLLTYVGLSLFGMEREGNAFLQNMMRAYGFSPVLFVSKIAALLIVLFLTGYAHRRKWVRPLIAAMCCAYLVFAVLPWTYLISSNHSRGAASPYYSGTP